MSIPSPIDALQDANLLWKAMKELVPDHATRQRIIGGLAWLAGVPLHDPNAFLPPPAGYEVHHGKGIEKHTPPRLPGRRPVIHLHATIEVGTHVMGQAGPWEWRFAGDPDWHPTGPPLPWLWTQVLNEWDNRVLDEGLEAFHANGGPNLMERGAWLA